jgi:hypothetical protein
MPVVIRCIGELGLTNVPASPSSRRRARDCIGERHEVDHANRSGFSGVAPTLETQLKPSGNSKGSVT